MGRAMVDVDKATDIVESIRQQLPKDLETARQIAADRERLLGEADAEAQHVVDQAHQQAADLVHQEGVYRTAERQARALLDQATARAEEIRARSDEYAMESLQSLEIRLAQTLSTVQNGIATLQAHTTRTDARDGSAPPE